MEKITDYKVSDFFKIQDENIINSYVAILDVLKPLKTINNPKAKWYNNEPKMLSIKAIRSLSFGEVTDIRNSFNDGTIVSVFESIKLVTGLTEKQILDFTITQLYGIISFIKEELIAISNMELNELTDESFDINVETVNAKERMSRFGVLNAIDSLAKEDILKWEQIQKLPYLTVFTKLMMDNEKNKIHQEIAELQRKKQLKN